MFYQNKMLMGYYYFMTRCGRCIFQRKLSLKNVASLDSITVPTSMSGIPQHLYDPRLILQVVAPASHWRDLVSTSYAQTTYRGTMDYSNAPTLVTTVGFHRVQMQHRSQTFSNSGLTVPMPCTHVHMCLQYEQRGCLVVRTALVIILTYGDEEFKLAYSVVHSGRAPHEAQMLYGWNQGQCPSESPALEVRRQALALSQACWSIGRGNSGLGACQAPCPDIEATGTCSMRCMQPLSSSFSRALFTSTDLVMVMAKFSISNSTRCRGTHPCCCQLSAQNTNMHLLCSFSKT